MKKIEITNTSVTYEYEAADGTMFKDVDECRKYEKTMRCALGSYLKDKAVKDGCYGDMLSLGCYEDRLVVLIPKTVDDIIKIKQVVASYGNPNGVDVITEKHIGRPILLDINYDGDGAYITILDDLVGMLTDGKFKVVSAEV